MASPFGSTTDKAETDPIVDGGVYIYEHKDKDGNVVATETGTVMGVWRDLEKGTVLANLYHYKRGSEPSRIVEGTESFSQWKLIWAPTKSAATRAINVYLAEQEAKAEAEAEAKAIRRAS